MTGKNEKSDQTTVAFMASSLVPGGAERVITELANAYSEKCNVIIITFQDSNSYYKIDNRVKIFSCVERVTPSENIFQAIYSNTVLCKKMITILKNQNVDICISFLTTVNVISTLAAKICKIPIIISERNNPIVVPPNLFWRKLRNLIYPLCDYLVVQSQGSKDFFSKIVSEKKIKIIINPVSESLRLRNRYPVENKNELIILSVGRLTRNKAVHIALEALNGLKEYSWKFKIAGHGDQRIHLEKLTKNLNMEDRVEFLGNVKDILALYMMADIFIFTSRSEGFPNALVEAYYCGVPCIATNCNFGPKDIITDSKDGFLVPVDNVSVIRERLKSLLTNPSLRIDFHSNATDNRSRFEMPNVLAEWMRVTNSLLDK